MPPGERVAFQLDTIARLRDQPKRPGADRIEVRRGRGDLGHRPARQQMRRHDVEQLQVGEKAGVVAREREADVVRVDGGCDDVLPALVEDGAGELRILHRADREHDVIGRDRRAVGPAGVGAQGKGVAPPVRGYVPVSRESSLDRLGL